MLGEINLTEWQKLEAEVKALRQQVENLLERLKEKQPEAARFAMVEELGEEAVAAEVKALRLSVKGLVKRIKGKLPEAASLVEVKALRRSVEDLLKMLKEKPPEAARLVEIKAPRQQVEDLLKRLKEKKFGPRSARIPAEQITSGGKNP